MNKLLLSTLFAVAFLSISFGSSQEAFAGMAEITVTKTVTSGGPLDANSFDLFVDDGVITQVQNGVPHTVNPGSSIKITESISDPLTTQYLPTYSGDCIEDNLNDDKRNQIHDLVAKANALQAAINANPNDPLNDDKEQSIHDLLSKARALFLAISATVPINQGNNLSCEITNDFLPVTSPTIHAVGGTLIPIDTTALLLASAQSTSWMIPVVLSVLGIGLFVVSRKSENS